MPRRDPTFTGADVVRIWARNLDRREQEDVLALFLFLDAAFGLRDRAVLNLIGSVAGLIPGIGDVIEISLELAQINQALLGIAEQGQVARRLLREAGLPFQDVLGLFRDLR